MLWFWCSCKQANICMSFFITCQSEKTYTWNWSKKVFSTFFINLFIKTWIKRIIYCQTVPLDHLLMYVAKILCQASVPLLFTWVSLAIFCSEKYQIEIVCSPQRHSQGEITNCCMIFEWWQLLVHIIATYFAQLAALKSVYGKGQQVIAGKLFLSCVLKDSVFSRFQSKKWLEKSMQHLSRNKALTICQDREFELFLCTLSIW